MTRFAAALVVVGVLGACGGSDSKKSEPARVKGTVLGQAFDPVDGTALVLSPETCIFQNVLQASATAILVGFGTFENMCQVAQQTKACGGKANGTTVNLIVLNASAVGTATAVQPGTYPVTTAQPDVTKPFTVATAFIAKTDATCADSASAVEATAGTITIDKAGADRVTGNANITFSDGSSVSGAFDVPVCAFSTDVCTGLGAGCKTPTCVP
ncbi:hypothetical protein [Anaeromyxobacter terrae]|uniref:hypothetical protein n=1 Tax=Anaeromyxobacter terrae TaxID=2925406 RepID=UPI001F5AA077|nr:hypothetical protein [Anaeromyxobacter sp. SG22]